MAHNRVILVVRDGWGYTEKIEGNSVNNAHTPNNDRYMNEYPWTVLKCTGNAVGLPEGTQGGSEPGHITMGAGRVIWQPLEQINRAIRDGSFNDKKPFKDMAEYLKATGGRLHLAGLLSDQGIHGTTRHMHALLSMAEYYSIKDVFIHCFLDGRDVPERSAEGFLRETLEVIKEKGVGKVASLIGRYYAMDRDTNWNRTEVAYNLLTHGKGIKTTDPFDALSNQYSLDHNLTDYYVKPIVLQEAGEPVAVLKEGDAFILWNFRSDRARQITYALTQPDFDGFKHKNHPSIHYVCMSVYDRGLDLPVVFPQAQVEDNLGIILSRNGFKQLRIAETEKYAHVTYFFNSQIEKPYPGEERVMVPSPKVPSYEDQPEMSAEAITSKVIPKIKHGGYDFILLNYANGDLVGHSANMRAGVKAVEVVDKCCGEVVETGLSQDYIIIITGDHGNVEAMRYPDGSNNPSHGLNDVPFILISNKDTLKHIQLLEDAGLSSIAPTVLELMNVDKPQKMISPSLLP